MKSRGIGLNSERGCGELLNQVFRRLWRRRIKKTTSAVTITITSTSPCPNNTPSIATLPSNLSGLVFVLHIEQPTRVYRYGPFMSSLVEENILLFLCDFTSRNIKNV